LVKQQYVDFDGFGRLICPFLHFFV
jgi:hypothetical protein